MQKRRFAKTESAHPKSLRRDFVRTACDSRTGEQRGGGGSSPPENPLRRRTSVEKRPSLFGKCCPLANRFRGKPAEGVGQRFAENGKAHPPREGWP